MVPVDEEQVHLALGESVIETQLKRRDDDPVVTEAFDESGVDLELGTLTETVSRQVLWNRNGHRDLQARDGWERLARLILAESGLVCHRFQISSR